MSSSIRRSLIGLSMIALPLFVLLASAQGQEAPPKHDNLKLLERFVGTWDEEMTIKQSAWNPEAKSGAGSMTAKWTLDGRFLEIRSSSKLDGSQGLSIMGHDMNTDSLRGWFFHSHGFNHIATGTWDEKSKTLSWSADMGNGMKIASSDRFIDDNNFEWQFQIKDGNGQVMWDMTGKAKRQKQK